uniref:Ovo like zinc finger 2 n=1 Tax=Anas platyrhynchos platyrhynchos TaxID=8840 RepID=A0A493SZ60_ANAPP
MPRAFLVKRRSPQPAVRSWAGLPDEERADTYIPGEAAPGPIVSPPPGNGEGTPHPGGGQRAVEKGLLPRHEVFFFFLVVFAMSIQLSRSRSLPQFTTGTCNDATVHSCELCGKGFRLQRMLNRHIKCHSQVKRHLCTFCGKGFNDTFDLKRHVRTHTGIRPYKCEVCNKAFTQRCSLESHLKKIHGVQQQYAYKQRRDKLYVCEDCGYTGPTQEDLYLHVSSVHPGSAFLKKTSKKLAAVLQNKLSPVLQRNSKDDNKDE